jgi:3',5'-cyclic AMP phosphodiesterase CpdA
VPVRILHLSDLHLGRRETPEPGAALQEFAAGAGLDLVLATGDLAHRGQREQLERAAAFLQSLGAPLLAVPGNHDLPYTFPARFTRTFAEWERVFGTTAPAHASAALVAVGLNSARPWRQQGGALRTVDLESAVERLRNAPQGALRVVALHHHLAAPPWRARRKHPLSRRYEVLQSLATAGAELVVGGHVHQSAIAERREFETVDGERTGAIVLATVAGFGRPRPHRRGEALGFNVYEADAGQLTVMTHVWTGSSFCEVGRRTFFRG